MDFLKWHYTFGVDFYLLRFKNILLSLNHQFSLNLLLPTLFAPWKRLISTSNRKGFNLARDFEELSFNFVSRGIGAVVRLIVLVFGVFTLILVALGGIVGFSIWVALPFLSWSLYQLFHSQPPRVVKELLRGKTTLPREDLFSSDPGKFLISHLGASFSVDVFPEVLELSTTRLKSFEELMKEILSHNTLSDVEMRRSRVTKDDLLVCAAWWDERRTDKTVLNPEPSFTKPGIGLSLLFGYTPTLDKYVTDMGSPREFSHRLIGREETVSRMERVLSRGVGIFLSGIPGVGKKTVVFEFARRAREGLLGRDMSYKRILDFNYNAVFAGTGDVNTKKALLAQVLAEAESAGNVILLIRDIHRITNSQVEGMDFTDIFTQYLEKRKLLVISLVDKADYDRYVSRNERLKKFFEMISVTEISKADALEVLLSAARYSEKTRHIITPVPVLRSILTGSEAYLTETPFPEKALELFDSVLTYHEGASHDSTVTEEEVSMVLSEKTGIALSSMGDAQKKRLSNLEDIIHEKLISQEYPISLIAKALRAKTSGVVNNARPVGSFLFLGPTGVGKTETAKVLADVYFGSSANIIRLDMSEFGGSEGLERLIGNAARNIPGYLTTALSNKPATLLLLDEIEKAPPQVFNLFLSLLDEGKITDAFGKTVSAAHTFVVATSNAGSEYIREIVKEQTSKETLQKKVIERVMKDRIFTPEFLNRFDGVVVYEPLTPKHLKEIAKLQLSTLAQQVARKGIVLEFDESVYQKVAEEGYDPALGARPMRRMIELGLGDFIANAILKGEIEEGDSIRITADSGQSGYVWERTT